MIDLDPLLTAGAADVPGAVWSEPDAVAFADGLAGERFRVTWDPVAEDMIPVTDDDRGLVALVAIALPIAIVAAGVLDDHPGPHALPRVTRVASLYAPELSASPDVLRGTLLPGGWDAPDFDPAAFCGWDLFCETS